MDPDILITVIAALAIAVGLTGIVVPVLPGSILIIAALLGWALAMQSTAAWWAFGVGAALALAGLLSSAVLTGRKLKQRKVPNTSILAGVVVGVVGMFVIPVVGLIVGFAVGLLLSEYLRRRSLPEAWSASYAALKAMGLGILLELGFAFAAGTAFVGGIWWHFASR
ncbi:DUF456 domain-containing protein [Arthrobacter sp. zg-ZUI100]|uniref:DUF456 domain-containing protein n=1 Tax=Arthrobacter jiangjiafuii TaxID=2817475 RepID=A0A975R090_9MICC|nr:DUF456 domain-containing protein [Arthrobacter jiangjiafuii]MBP3035504.1 DUF456 domain-containing protein [Arthrobacter jiangjiafuii]MBP3042297.1 DUF456 domain-containing protein [Arthrobacter jiangjiafuii]QWC09947.1 DUF456 domain-containing protein [Arthrobacter jiangjiafuii]